MEKTQERRLLENAYRKIRELRAELDRGRSEPIAIIGMACRFPGAPDLDSYWELLECGREAITEAPPERWDSQIYCDPTGESPGTAYTNRGGFLNDVDLFEPKFFGLSQKEAECLDPQIRLLLELSWQALEHAGILPKTLAGSQTGVFVGTSLDDYAQLSFWRQEREQIDGHRTIEVLRASAAGRISYAFGFHGPAVFCDTACSSSLLAAHLACQSLRMGESDLALAGGANLILLPESYVGLCALGALSRAGQCRVFDDRADGYVRGEGAGLVVLKRLADAERDGDPILSVIRGSSTNHDGFSNGFTAPNGLAQERVISEAVARAGVSPEEIQYVEAHGTGTPLGDPIEVGALHRTLGRNRTVETPLRIGSVKSNFGHLESAAGVASLIKVVLSMQRGQLPPSLHVASLNSRLPWDELSVAVVTERQPWPEESGRRRAGISGFSLTGSNVHLVLESAEDAGITSPPPTGAPHLLVASARTDASLRGWIKNLVEQCSREPVSSLSDLCFTAAVCRTAFEKRVAVVAESREDLLSSMRAYSEGRHDGACRSSDNPGAEPPKSAPSAHLLAWEFVQGKPIDWEKHFDPAQHRRVALPPYVFDRERYWTIPTRRNQTSTSGKTIRLSLDGYGSLDRLAWVDSPRPSPRRGEVEIEVAATGLNFRDVARASGRLRKAEEASGIVSPDQIWFGFECAGRVVRVGQGAPFAVGDDVLGLVPGGMARHVNADARLLVRRPITLSVEFAAAIPTVYLTAYYALTHLAKLQPGETVMIHSAAGGVGQAAFRLARRTGAEIIATASAAKWGFLHEQGAKSVFDSRNVEFVDSVRELTRGAGVDVVLNTQGERLEAASLDCLKPGGRFIEVGRIASPPVPPAGNFCYHHFNLLSLCSENPGKVAANLEKLLEWISNDPALHIPVSPSDASDIQEAFQTLREGGNVGKVVIRNFEGASGEGRGRQSTEIVSTVEEVTRRALGRYAPDTIDPDRRVEDLGLDSVGMFELIVELERSFDIRIDETALNADSTLHDVNALVRRLCQDREETVV